ncbi:hypothetical protein BCV70DRAFT_201905 [Testicularia cyperi]|uniref:DUF3074 domain-containing protein n=1 Tax=Testicularia cyperi TaxID=1882483 RepID=A0A317XMJ0_9BASI|nr:hypothetical protein BCV70DRAFT_201905 [Testicularia cyperi]
MSTGAPTEAQGLVRFEPFQASEIDFASIPLPGTPEYADFLCVQVTQAFSMVRHSPGWKKGKSFSTPTGGSVQCRTLSSGMSGKLGKCAWHLRESKHTKQQCGLDYDDFRNTLRYDHPTNEKHYIDAIQQVDLVTTIKEKETEIWHNSYKLPIVTADRDFVELLLTLDLPPHASPFSEEHEQATLSAIRSGDSSADSSGTSADASSNRSFLVIQMPVSHPDRPETPPQVRAVYASFEAVWEEPSSESNSGPDAASPETTESSKTVVWKMAVQSDGRGKIPTMMQEMSMPANIAHDVPAFIEWKTKQNSSP